TVMDAINQKGQHAIIYGERGVGKTSLSNVLHSFLGHQAFPVLAPRVQCEAQDSFDKVWRRVFDKIELLRERQTMRMHSPIERESYRASELLEGAEVSPDDVRRILAIISQAALSIVIVDEFDRLSKERRRPFADTVKTLSDHAVPATVILVGVADSVDQLIQEHQSVERALVQVSVPRMSDGEIRQIVSTGLEKLGMTIAPEALQ